jgi:hypothetical protein
MSMSPPVRAAVVAPGVLAAPASRRPASANEAIDPRALDAPPRSSPLNKPLYEFNERELDVYLKYLHAAELDLRRRVILLARKNFNQPYEIFLLGEYPFEVYDPDPMFCLAKSDCVTFSEHTYAMALAHDWPSFFRFLQRLRYKDGKVGTLTRNHETLCEWDRHNTWLLEDVTRSLGGGAAFVALHGEWRPAKFFAQFGIGQDRPDVDVTDVYIPRDKVASIQPELMDGDFVNVIRGDAKVQWAGHVGLIGHGEDGTVHFIHSTKPNVREEPLQAYLERNPKVLGFKFLRLRADAEASAARELAR